MANNRIYEIDVFRGFSALFIISFHYTTQYENSIGHLGHYYINVPWGYMAVCVFSY